MFFSFKKILLQNKIETKKYKCKLMEINSGINIGRENYKCHYASFHN